MSNIAKILLFLHHKQSKPNQNEHYLPADGAEAPAKISFDGEAAGIDAVTTTSTSANGAVYDLSGRRVAANLAAAKLAKGIYVVNGKKVAVK